VLALGSGLLWPVSLLSQEPTAKLGWLLSRRFPANKKAQNHFHFWGLTCVRDLCCGFLPYCRLCLLLTTPLPLLSVSQSNIATHQYVWIRSCNETPQSSFVRKICYDAAKSYMLIELNDTWYHYCAVDSTSVDSLVHASSVGTYYNQHFRSQGPVHGPFDCRDHPVPDYH